jgi:hypothetical protein
MLVRKCQKNVEHGTRTMSFRLSFSGVNKTVKKKLHVMQNKIIRFIKGFDNRKRVNMISFLNHVNKFYILPN